MWRWQLKYPVLVSDTNSFCLQTDSKAPVADIAMDIHVLHCLVHQNKISLKTGGGGGRVPLTIETAPKPCDSWLLYQVRRKGLMGMGTDLACSRNNDLSACILQLKVPRGNPNLTVWDLTLCYMTCSSIYVPPTPLTTDGRSLFRALLPRLRPALCSVFCVKWQHLPVLLPQQSILPPFCARLM